MFFKKFRQPSQNDIRVGKNITKAIEESGMSRDLISIYLRLPPGHLSKLESGKKRPSDEYLVNLSVLFDVSVYRLLKQTPEQNQ